MNAETRTKAHEITSDRRTALPRVVSAVAFRLAISTAIIVVVLRLIHSIEPGVLPWTLRSAVPLILIGIAFASLQFALPRTRAQKALGLVVAAAFVLWGVEQFLPNHELVLFIDDIVVFLFVLDLTIVIHGHLKPPAHLAEKGSLLDEPGL